MLTLLRTVLLFALFLSAATPRLQAQGMKVVGIVPFTANSYQDSLAAKNIYATIATILVQTRRFKMLEMEKWTQLQDEIQRQKGKAFLETDIIAQGKSLGAQVLVFGSVTSAELYKEDDQYVAQVTYNMRFVDVATGTHIAAETFSGDSRSVTTKVASRIKSLNPLIDKVAGTNNNTKGAVIAKSMVQNLPATESKSVEQKTMVAIDKTAEPVRAWIRNTFGLHLAFLKVLNEENGSVKNILIEGGEDLDLRRGRKLKSIVVTEMETGNGIVRDEEVVAQLEVVEVRPQTSKCKVLEGGTRMREEKENKHMRIVLD